MKEEPSPSTSKPIRPRKPSASNPLQSSIYNYLQSQSLTTLALDRPSLPKRYTLYAPLLLLPTNFSTHSPVWTTLYSSLTDTQRQSLFQGIATAFKAQGVTHIAINAPITLSNTEGGAENVMRSPSGLIPVLGDFGPTTYSDDGPTQADFDSAFWVSTVQHQRVVQCWAPRWTMFSRGNISEKARILGETGSMFPGLGKAELGEDLDKVEVVDMYVGIGYFALCYLKRGVRRVWGWDINGWSIEGLRRGCSENGWKCVVVKVDEGGLSEQTILDLVQTLVEADGKADPVRCVSFWGDNRWADEVHHRLQTAFEAKVDGIWNVRHANLGLLPSSRGSWKSAIRILESDKQGWLHVHENVDIHEIAQKKVEVMSELTHLCRSHKAGTWQIQCTHIEQVKTYAPGIMHCVFDISISPAR